ncbi:Nramp family divalent metal transporter [Sphingomonas sp.]|uniref:Nramp family divalent metal transporter n=1 Tax=Sphingomonas sp. TaxID=28214 RepID=UPI000DB80EB1|nr:Nramp family divalent metal transporter [Sphingomonas sp.]PZU10152.1 MAG: divalent metal cation transporter [Sphingomonas sp.]
MSLAARLRLPTTATAPFCPSEVEGQIVVPPGAPLSARMARFAGPGLLVAVGYMDPGNWATDIAAGSGYGFDLLFVVVAASLAAILLQSLALRLGLASGLDLAQACRRRYGRPVAIGLWALAEIAIVATDVAEVLGGALAIKLLLGLPLWAGILLTACDMLLVIGLKGRGFRQVEAIVAALVATIALCFLLELLIVPPDPAALWHGLWPDAGRLAQPGALAIAVGIVGATVMPHNLYLHSSIVQTRRVSGGEAGRRSAIRIANIDSAMSLLLAMLVNGAILTLAAGAFHATGHVSVTGIDDAYRLLSPITGAKAAALFFGIALLASGQSSTFTGTIAGQVVLEGFLKLKIPCWQRRIITRLIAIVPAMAGVIVWGDDGVGPMLVLSQIVLSLQLPFAIWPLIRTAGDRAIMGSLAAGAVARGGAWLIFAVISAANLWLLSDLFG